MGHALRFATPLVSRFRDRAFARRIVASFTLLAFLTAYFPIPFPVVRGVASNEAYPCQSGRCGCASAKQCWTNCCCLSPRERRAWAEREGVTPPAYAILDDADAPVEASEATVRSCCAAKPAAKASMAKSSSAKPSCCVASESCDSPVEPDSAQLEETVYALTVSAMKCRGAASDFNSLAWFVWRAANLEVIGQHGADLDQRLMDEWADSFAADLTPPPPQAV